MTKKKSVLIGVILLIAAILFAGYAGTHPEASFPWSNRVTFMLYGAYLWMIFKFLIGIPLQQSDTNNSFLRGIMYLLMALVFFAMEVTGDSVNIYTVMRGFIVLGGLDMGVESIFRWSKEKRFIKRE